MSLKHATTLITSLCARGAVRHARDVFDEMPDRDVVAWTAMLSGYASSGCHREALDVFRRMLAAGVVPNEFTLSSVLTACRGGDAGGGGGAASIHAVAVMRGVDHMPYVVNALIDAYASRGDGLVDARSLFDTLGAGRTAASWTSMIAGYARWGMENTGLQLFQKMIQDDIELSPFTCSIAIHACASLGDLYTGQQIHVVSIRKALGANLAVANSLIDMYCTCESIVDARRLFDEMPERNLVTWNTIIAGSSRNDPRMAMQLLVDMDIEPNCLTLTSITSACAGLAALRCGQQVFNMMACKDILSWTSMIGGYGMNGYANEAIDLFNSMVHAGVRPDHVVFVGLISACSHAGLVDEGWNLFMSMLFEYSIQPNMEIYGCVTNLLARAGRLREAFNLIDTMPLTPDESVWGALLGACKMHKNVELGRLAARKIIEINPDAAKTYILLANIYAADSKWGDYAVMRRWLRGTGSSKEVGMSWIEVTDKMYSFSTADSNSLQVSLADEVLRILVQHMDEAGNDFDENLSKVA
uniref:Pentatricopeptide repeat-containing protein n=1 Tax=Setaria italica TaxID=4555 RepID=K3XT44_SETIT